MNDESERLGRRKLGIPPVPINVLAKTTAPAFDAGALIGSLRRQYKYILSSIFVLLIIALCIVLYLDKRFSATALIVVEGREAQLVGMDDSLWNAGSLNNRIDTEKEIVKSQAVLLATIRKLGLWKDKEFGLHQRLTDSLQRLFSISKQGPDLTVLEFDQLSDQDKSELVRRLEKSVDVARRGLTSVIEVTATSKSPKKAADIANAVVAEYLNSQIDSMMASAKRAADFLQGRVDEIAAAIKQVDGKLTNFVSDYGDRLGTAGDRAELTRLRGQLEFNSETQSTLSKQLALLEKFSLTSDPQLLATGNFGQKFSALLQKQVEVAGLARSKPADLVLKTELAKIDSELHALAGNSVAQLRTRLGNATAENEKLQEDLQALFSRQTVPPEVSLALYRLQQEAETNNKLYQAYSARLADVRQQASFTLANSRIVAEALAPDKASYPPTLQIMAIAGLLAIGLGITSALLREHLFGGFTSAEQLESVTSLPVAATVPVHANAVGAAVTAEPLSEFAETIRRLRVSALTSLPKSRCGIVSVTSTVPSEGKTVISFNLAQSLATMGRRTLLIDADLRRPSIEKLLKDPPSLGLSNYLLEQISLSELPLWKDADTGLSVLLAGPSTSGASDVLLGSKRFSEFVSGQLSSYDVIVIDCAPIAQVVDARLLNPLTDVLVYVVRYGLASQREIVHGLREMAIGRDLTTIRTVLNMARSPYGGRYLGYGTYNSYQQG